VVPFNGYCRQILDIAHHRVVSYQSSCSDHSWHRRHDVHRQRCLQPGHCPRVAKVFHTVPQLLNGGSGPSTESQHHRLECEGCHPHRGHLIELATPSSSSDVVVTRSPGDGSRFNSWSDIRSNRAIGSSCREYRKTWRPHPGRNSTRCRASVLQRHGLCGRGCGASGADYDASFRHRGRISSTCTPGAVSIVADGNHRKPDVCAHDKLRPASRRTSSYETVRTDRD